MKKQHDQTPDQLTPQNIAQRRDDALRRSLNTPPKQHKDMKKGKGKGKKREDRPTASSERRPQRPPTEPRG